MGAFSLLVLAVRVVLWTGRFLNRDFEMLL